MANTSGKTAFLALLKALNVPESLDADFLFATYMLALEGMKNLQSENPVIARMGTNPAFLVLYLSSEHAFYLASHPDKSQEELIKDEKYGLLLASIAVDKYYTNEFLNFKMGALTSRFDPSSSTIDLYLNFILGMLSRYKQGDPRETLVIDVMNKGFQMAKCVSSLLEGGFETEAFSTWRTLHENECILQVLVKYGRPVMDAYVRHLSYAAAFRGAIPDKEKTDAIFVEIKEKMKAIGLKSKDMKRFIEYGWLLGVPNVMDSEDFKFNFRNGVEKVAGLSNYAQVYEMSSEIAHSSPLLIYSKKHYFYLVAQINLYESFFRLEKVFASIYMSTVPEEDKQRYLKMRSLYYGQLMACYDLTKKKFLNLQKGK